MPGVTEAVQRGSMFSNEGTQGWSPAPYGGMMYCSDGTGLGIRKL